MAMLRCLADAAVVGAEGAGYCADMFTSLKPDVYYFAKPRAAQHDPTAREEWHFQQGRREVLDYIFYDRHTLELEAPVEVPHVSGDDIGASDAQPPAKKSRGDASGQRTSGSQSQAVPYGFWAGSWDFVSSPDAELPKYRHNPFWRPKRKRGALQLGIPNRLHGSDHLPVVCTLRFRENGAGLPAKRCGHKS